MGYRNLENTDPRPWIYVGPFPNVVPNETPKAQDCDLFILCKILQLTT